jgi:mRNA interferase RelE/StbE
MPVYILIYSKEATKSLQRMPRNTARLIREKLEIIAADPYADHPNAKKLQGREGYRLRVGDWRVVYKIQSEQLIIIVLKVASRGEVYK